ncbi:MAG: type I glyceraldehyde-3-phosphate dehydrogenase [Parcubacteria group bacterium CG2_30_44_11]|nr:MAG: type I glyceraldehyde-3-phosphate dehydrogenase [Parcubacteria group bacterium CG2_30_44_11]
MARVAINGFGRIGRTFFKLAFENPEINIVAINDLGSLESLAYLLKYDTVYGQSPFTIEIGENALIVNGRSIAVVKEKDPKTLPWAAMKIDIVIEATGFFTSYEQSQMHIDAGAKRVVITGPVKDVASAVPGATVLMGVNEADLTTCSITSNASCTTNATSPVIGVMNAAIGVEKAILNTVHAYTATQSLVDGPSKKDLRGGRAAAQNIIPSSTGAAKATTLAHTELVGKFDGIAIRVPVPCGSIVDVTFIASRPTTVEEVNAAFVVASQSDVWKDILAVTDEPLVSSDIIGARFASIVDLAMTRVVDGNLVKVLAWYDNETSYAHTLVLHTIAIAKLL